MKTIRRVRALLPILLFAVGAHSAMALNCGSLISSNTTLTADLQCSSNALIVVADNVTLNLNGHTISCVGGGFMGSCQFQAGPVGIYVIHHNNVQILGPGTIRGFEIGVSVDKGLGVRVKGLTITGPPQPDVVGNPRSPSVGVLVSNTLCTVGTVALPSVTVDSNDISNHLQGIQVQNGGCAVVTGNTVHDNDGPQSSYGIALVNATHSSVLNNFVYANGSNNLLLPPDAGIAMSGLGTQYNSVSNNTVIANCGDGIASIAGASNNNVALNVARFNPLPIAGQCRPTSTDFKGYDLATTNSQPNNWNPNNLCRTQTAVDIPAGVCNPGE
jgi:hypothetical protein